MGLSKTLKVLTCVIEQSLDDICRISDERIIQDLLASKMKAKNLHFTKRTVIKSEIYPDMEIDLIETCKENGVAIEVKVNPRFYEGVGQAIMLKELYGREAVLLQVYDEVSERVINALRVASCRTGIKVILVSKKGKWVKVIP